MKTFHFGAGILATAFIGMFFVSTLGVEMLGSDQDVALVKHLIVTPGLFLLVPAIAVTAGTGFRLAKSRTTRLVETKKKRMPIIGLNGVLILIPCAVLLDHWASAGAFDTWFVSIQGLELLAGAVNLTLMGLNIRDGLRMSGRFRAVRQS